MNIFMKYVAGVAFLLAASGCTQHEPQEKTLERQKCAAVYAELMRTRAAMAPGTRSADSLLTERKTEILGKYGVTEEALRATMRSYAGNVKQWKDFYDDVVKKLEEASAERPPSRP